MLNLLNFAQADDAESILNNTPQTPVNDPTTTQLTGEQAEQAAGIFAGMGILFLVIGLIGLVFFILALVHLIKNPNVPNRVLWIVLVILFGGLAGFIYYVGPRRSYEKSKSSGSSYANDGPTAQYQNPAAPPAQTTGQAVGATGAAVGTQNNEPSKISDFASADQAASSPTAAEPQPQVAAAPENPVQVPPAPEVNVPLGPESSSESQNQSSDPQVFSPGQPSQGVTPESSQDENSSWQDPQNPNNQA